jgi:signal transduction histidine kinase
MNAIVGFTSLLESPGLPEEARNQYLDIIYQSSNQLLSIITDIVDISNIDAGQVRITLTDVDVNNILKNINDQYKLRAEKQRLKLICSLQAKRGKIKLHTDETKLVQIISNLLDNSFKFTVKGKIEFGCVPTPGAIEFFVRDTGSGIKKGDLTKIFERFYQGENHLNNKTEGTGLGLSICKSYVELLGGKIGVKSSYGKSTEFRFTLPAVSRKKVQKANKTS